MGPIGLWVMESACRDAAGWARAGLGELSIAVNVSKAQFSAGDLCGTVRQALFDTGLPARQLMIELTESMLMEDVDTVLATLQELKLLGVSLSIDDFGTGYSSLSYLRRFPLDELKIDRSFIVGLADQQDAVAIVQTVIEGTPAAHDGDGRGYRDGRTAWLHQASRLRQIPGVSVQQTRAGGTVCRVAFPRSLIVRHGTELVEFTVIATANSGLEIRRAPLSRRSPCASRKRNALQQVPARSRGVRTGNAHDAGFEHRFRVESAVRPSAPRTRLAASLGEPPARASRQRSLVAMRLSDGRSARLEPHWPAPTCRIDNCCQVGDHLRMSTTSTMNIALPEPLRAYVAERVESGQYGNTSEYVRDLIRRDQLEQRVQRLRALVEEGLASGPATPDKKADWDELRAIARGKIE